MKKLLMATTALVAFAAIGPAGAADMPLKAPPMAAPAYNWTGWYAGGNIGYSWGNADSNYYEPAFACGGCAGLPTSISQSQKLDGIIGGGQIGYNWQANAKWVFGLEADLQGSGEKGSTSNSDPYTYCIDCEGGPIHATLNETQEAKIQWFGTVRGRAGVLVNPTTWLYGTGGLAYGRISTSGTFTDTRYTPAYSWSYGGSTTKAGWTLGAGIEGAVPNRMDWTWKLEYLYIDFGTISGSGFDTDFRGPYSWSTRVTDNILRVGLNYRFH